MGIYAEKRDKLVARIEELTKRISDDTKKKQELELKLKDATRLAMAEEFNCKPRELDDIISSEHSLLQKLRASGLTDAELLELVGISTDDSGSTPTDKNADGKSADSSDSDNADGSDSDDADSSDSNNEDSADSDTAEDSTEDDDEIKFYGDVLTD
ncbi:MAG: hypothetical protein IJ740_17245 [Ruminococcus sp.]|nr:hypothetical protein [Ruminococcus sp.]